MPPPHPLCFSPLAVSVTVGGKQYLLGLYDTAGQVSAERCPRTLGPDPRPAAIPALKLFAELRSGLGGSEAGWRGWGAIDKTRL